MSGVKGERPQREGVKKEAVEQVLAAAAAKPAPSVSAEFLVTNFE